VDAKVVWDKDIVVVNLSGTMDFDKAFEFRKKSFRHFLQNKVVFSLKELNFIGSTGISSFVDTLTELAKQNPNGVKLCNVGLEFRKLLEVHIDHKLQLFTDIESAKKQPENSNL
jgi:anti-anti-sigma factor